LSLSFKSPNNKKSHELRSGEWAELGLVESWCIQILLQFSERYGTLNPPCGPQNRGQRSFGDLTLFASKVMEAHLPDKFDASSRGSKSGLSSP
jgi:hypothetical protein